MYVGQKRNSRAGLFIAAGLENQNEEGKEKVLNSSSINISLRHDMVSGMTSLCEIYANYNSFYHTF